jgi:hypothetical protein
MAEEENVQRAAAKEENVQRSTFNEEKAATAGKSL